MRFCFTLANSYEISDNRDMNQEIPQRRSIELARYFIFDFRV